MRALKKIFLGLLVVIVLLLAAAIFVASVFEEKIGRALITEVNAGLKSELKVKDFNLSLISGFPDASVNLYDVVLKDALDGVLLETEELSFRFGLFSLFGSKIKVHTILIKNGSLFVKIDKRGRENYDIAKASETESTAVETELGISLEEAILKNVELIYENEKVKETIAFTIDQMSLSGEFGNQQYELKSKAAIQSRFFEVGEVRYLVGKKLGYDADIFVNQANGANEFRKVKLMIEDNVFNVEGFLTNFEKSTDFALTFKSEDADLNDLLQLLPPDQFAEYGDFSSDGSLSVDASINGELSADSDPAIDVKISLEDGSITSEKMDGSVKDVSFVANYSNGSDHSIKTATFDIKDFKGYFNRDLVEINLAVKDFENPLIDFNIDGKIDVETVYGLLDNPAITDGGGDIEFKEIRLRGRYEDMINSGRINKVKLEGEINFDDAELTFNKEDVTFDKGRLKLQDNLLLIENFEIEGVGSELKIDGQFENLLPVLFADSLNSKNAELKFLAKLHANELDIERLLKMTEVQVEEEDVGKEVYDSMLVAKGIDQSRLTSLLDGTFEATFDEFSYGELEGENFAGQLRFDNNAMQIKGETNALEGFLDLDGIYYFEKAPRLVANIECLEINVFDLFDQTKNLGQEFLVAKNLRGSMNGKFHIQTFWSEAGYFQYDKLRVYAGIGIHDGELRNFKMLEDFSTYVDIDDLRRVKFTNMQNWLEIRREKIYFPTMFIQSNAMNMTLNGEHTFDQEIEYNIQVNAGQILMNKFKRNKKLKPIKAKKRGLFNLYFNVKGTVEDFDYKTDKSRVNKAFIKSERRKREIKAKLKKEFGSAQMLDKDKKAVDFTEIPELDEGDGPDEFLDGF